MGVWATAGAGKTTAVRQAVVGLGRPVAWLTLDPTDAAPGRLLVYLEAALRRGLPDFAGTTGEALAAGIIHAEAAAMLAEAVPRRPAVLVLDEIERIADSAAALEVISTFVRYVDPAVRVAARRAAGASSWMRSPVSATDPWGPSARSSWRSTTPEAAGALALRGVTEADPQSVVEATGGWVAGVLFEAWRSREHVGGSGGEADALAGYLAAEILDGLSEEERDFLVRTSLFAEVTAARAEALGVADAAELLGRLRGHHLPGHVA